MKKLFNYFHPLNQLERQRVKRLRQGNLPEPLQALLSEPYPLPEANLNELDFLVLDLETTGLHPEEDHILSLGYLQISGFRLNLKSSVHTFVQADKAIKPETAVINHIVPEMLSDGETLDEAMMTLFEHMKGKILIAHGTVIEKNFIDYYLMKRYNLEPLPLLWLDTLLMEKSLTRNKNDASDGDYRLASIRERHGLPEYSAHSALIDAVATGELFFALVKIIFGQATPCLGRVFRNYL